MPTLSKNERVRQYVWSYLLYPIWPRLEAAFNLLHAQERQPYHIGWLAPGKTLEDLKAHLSAHHGFGNHFVAWTDPDEVLSWRKLESFRRQYHIRVFSDGEIRGHYEFTPEALAIRHFFQVGQEERRAELMAFLGDMVVERMHVTALASKREYEQFGFSASGSTMKTYKVPAFLHPFTQKN